MTTRTMPMPENPTWFDELQAAMFPWFGTPEGWDAILDAQSAGRSEPEAET